MFTKVERLVQEIEKLSAQERHLLCWLLLQKEREKPAVPPSSPEGTYDDWDDPEADSAHTE